MQPLEQTTPCIFLPHNYEHTLFKITTSRNNNSLCRQLNLLVPPQKNHPCIPLHTYCSHSPYLENVKNKTKFCSYYSITHYCKGHELVIRCYSLWLFSFICVAFEVTNLGMEGVQSKRLECVGFVMMMLTKMRIVFLD